MERPSHISFRTACPVSCRLIWSGVAISLPLVILWALANDMVAKTIAYVGPIVMVKVQDPVKPMPPPPPLVLMHVIPLTVDKPVIDIAPAPQNNAVIAGTTQGIVKQEVPPIVGPDRAAVGITATHTIPPYPALAQRIGEEGKVVLRLTVLANGKVGNAEIVTSSGSHDLDEAAQAWIVAHWLYKPALARGEPAASQALASMVFTLPR